MPIQPEVLGTRTRVRRYAYHLINLIRRAKRTHYDGEFERAKDDLKSTWKLINEIINKRKSKPAMPSTFKIDDNSVRNFVNIFLALVQSLLKRYLL